MWNQKKWCPWCHTDRNQARHAMFIVASFAIITSTYIEFMFMCVWQLVLSTFDDKFKHRTLLISVGTEPVQQVLRLQDQCWHCIYWNTCRTKWLKRSHQAINFNVACTFTRKQQMRNCMQLACITLSCDSWIFSTCKARLDGSQVMHVHM